MVRKLNILFLCTGNSCRSQMAEGWTRELKGDVVNVFSAGIDPQGLNPYAVRVMADANIDISLQKSRGMDEFREVSLDYIITVCDNAKERCPVMPGGARHIHVPFDDPPSLSEGLDDEAAKLMVYARVRDEIRDFVLQLPEILERR